MLFCPACKGHLQTVRHRGGVYYACDRCGSRAATVPQIRRMAGDDRATQVLRLLRGPSDVEGRPCPFCNRPMHRFHLPDPPLELDGCRPCGVVWFDPLEMEVLPEAPPLNEHAQELMLRERIARMRLEELARKAEAEAQPEGWHWLPMILGMPAELNDQPLGRFPWATLGIGLLMVAASCLAWWFGEAAFEQWGLIPDQWARMGGLTFLTGFFLHSDVVHLFGNLYFLLVFGDNVEDYLGHKRWLLLLFGSALVGDVLHVLFDPRGSLPCVGASGGISGLVTFYALQFPNIRLAMLVYWRVLTLTAGTAWFLWVAFQVLQAILQIEGYGHVSAVAHLGGAVTGLVAWWLHERRPGAGNQAGL
ncbi:MAG: hypothetical protein KatS3mg132_656 [Limisphaera sp.]|nr:MAG: hypothetical protein KatS3mg132_656 [Limisphaera sp.]